VDVSALPPRPVDRNTAAAGRRFNREELVWQQQHWSKGPEENPDYGQFYSELHRSLSEGVEPAITPQSVRRTLAVLERCRAAATAVQNRPT
jgi:hypothetical protein